ncbi:putative glutathione S-transferase [Tieghemostelium lacteum]|uniref:Putative glutathione S-transferase n=1 Tax=Tieghemostelium lacteum TaxID=361077 RepID=A0A152AA92_TIELA|nr:putative glutathione S-transferase [Tieghemostelium lacteum]|eukprot:KYR03139.1 putative glutathione S-transferase [Tieghemostelium lacteum]
MKPTLIYFNGLGRGEIIRFLLSYFEVDFEDIRINSIAELEKYKPDLLFGQVPQYKDCEIGNIVQTNAICRYIAEKYGVRGKDIVERAKIDEIFESTEDIYMAQYIAHRDGNAIEIEKICKILVPKYCAAWETILNKKSNGKYFFGDKATLADLSVFKTMNHLKVFDFKISTESYPKLNAMLADIGSQAQVQKYVHNCRITPLNF